MWLPCLLFLLFLHVGSIMHAAPHSSVIQTPATVSVEEGSTLNMQCRFNENKTKWAVNWYKIKGNESVELHNSSQIHIFTDLEDKLSNFALESVDLKDYGIYRCKVLSSDIDGLFSNGTQVTIHKITDFEVNQTSGPIHEVEGADVTIECRFRTVGRNSSMYVSWDKDGLVVEQANKTDTYRITQNLRAGFASLTLTNATVSDSGFYKCNVGREPRNQSKSSGIASHVVITKHDKQLETDSGSLGPGIGAGIGAGAAAGILLLLLLLSVLVSYKKRAKESTTETEVASNKEAVTHLPLTSQQKEVTYASVRFNKKEVEPDAGVIYAEVRTKPKQRAGNSQI